MSNYNSLYFDVIILAGGESKRFGEDKCEHEFNNKTFLQRVSEEFNQPIIVTSKIRNRVNGIQVIDNLRKGPVKGLELGLNYVSAGKVFVTGCDFPFVTSYLAQSLCNRGDYDITIVNVGKPQPLLACYNTNFLRENINNCKRMMDLLVLGKKIYMVGTFELKINGINLLTVKNVNSWLDLNFSVNRIPFTESKLILTSL